MEERRGDRRGREGRGGECCGVQKIRKIYPGPHAPVQGTFAPMYVQNQFVYQNKTMSCAH